MAWMTQVEAEAAVKRNVDADNAPELTDADITALVLATARATVWAASTAYDYGDRVVPTTRAGYVFTASVAGTSGSTEPVWPTLYGGASLWDVRWPHVATFNTGLADGTVEWAASAPDFTELYDVDAATREAWLLRAGRASQEFDIAADGTSLRSSQIYEHYLTMADKYRSVSVA